MERVQGWLGHPKIDAIAFPNDITSYAMNEKHLKMPQHSMAEKTATKTVVEKIPVVYRFPGDEQPYMSYFVGESMTLGQFKDFINKKGACKYFFMNISDLFEEEMVIYEEITEESQNVPIYKGKIVAKIIPID